MNILPPAVRIFPMKLEKLPGYKNIEDIQQHYFLDELPSREDCDFLLITGLRAERGSVILFQFGCSVIAEAILKSKNRFSHPNNEGYEGSLLLEKDSIKIFDPVPEAEIKRIWPNVTKLNRVRWLLDPENYMTFKSILKNIQTP